MQATCHLVDCVRRSVAGSRNHSGGQSRTQFTKSFDFAKAKTWSWHDGGPGEVKMARTADDNPEAVRQAAEPVILDAVAKALPQRGLTAAASGAASDLEVKYYVLITIGTQSQQMGQFLPAVAAWGLPPFSGATQSYKVIERARSSSTSAPTRKSCGAASDRRS